MLWWRRLTRQLLAHLDPVLSFYRCPPAILQAPRPHPTPSSSHEVTPAVGWFQLLWQQHFFTLHITPARWWSSLWMMVMRTCAWTSRLLWLHMLPLLKRSTQEGFATLWWTWSSAKYLTSKTEIMHHLFFHLKYLKEANISNIGSYEPQQLLKKNDVNNFSHDLFPRLMVSKYSREACYAINTEELNNRTIAFKSL